MTTKNPGARTHHGVRKTAPTERRDEIEEIVKLLRLSLYNKEVFCGAQAILWELEDMGVSPLPSLRTINRILARNELMHRRTGRYPPVSQ
jgi:hypothetical protein